MKDYYSYKFQVRLDEDYLDKMSLTLSNDVTYFLGQTGRLGGRLFQHHANLKANVDHYVSAEIPDPISDPRGYEAVKSCMMHGPCGLQNPKSPCMKDFKCTKFFQRSFPIYKRRKTGLTISKGKFELDNQFVVAYNRDLLVKYQCYLNVEICCHARTLKYLFKYCLKGHDRATVANTSERHHNENEAEKPVDEISAYFDGRYICASEAAYRVFGFPIHYCSIYVQRLSFHLPGEKSVTFEESDLLEKVVRREKFLQDSIQIDKMLRSIGKSLKQYKQLPMPPVAYLQTSSNNLIVAEISHESDIAELIKRTGLIIWDEAPMQHSVDQAEDFSGTAVDLSFAFPPEYLKSINILGLPPHELNLKVGVAVMLMRNLNQTLGLCNGTKLVVTKCLSKSVECEVICGAFVGTKHFRPRMELFPTKIKLPFKFIRKQMPLQICYSMTINKSQGQSLEKVGLFLPNSVFTHGQMYVVVSRVTSPEGLKVFINSSNGEATNITPYVNCRIHAFINEKICTAKGYEVEEGKIYSLANFKVSTYKADELNKVVRNEKHIFFDYETKFDKLKDKVPPIDEYTFDLFALEDVEKVLNDNRY
ncbi:uncharacterized protein LOC141689057 [Apium graveolens]|uniref:uncharacterized protein LOC141689057 n=1 Tax=Apium graveolens TaxID=4045 RepID=UPI003D79BE94